MATIQVSVKWGKQKFDNIELHVGEPPVVFKNQLFSLTGVPPERQKIMVKGGMLKDDGNWADLGIKAGHTFMMMGTADAAPQEPPPKTVFMEDLPEASPLLATTKLGTGLTNLGNTCYLNATLQCLRTVPELKHSLVKFKPADQRPESQVVSHMKELFSSLDFSGYETVPPLVFLAMFRQAFPQFNQQLGNGNYAQQDAEEAWTQLISTLQRTVPRIGYTPAAPAGSEAPAAAGSSSTLDPKESVISQLFGGELVTTLSCLEAPEEPKTVMKDTFTKLSCHIGNTTTFLLEGLKGGLEEQLSKTSPSLNRSANYKKESKITKLPYYLSVQFVRFFWKPEIKTKAKILKPVKFPIKLDVYDLCHDDLKAKLSQKRTAILQEEEKKLAQKDKQPAEAVSTAPKPSGATEIPTSFENETGIYELIAVLTHKGRTADSGHYVAWAKNDNGQWLEYDDDRVIPVTEEDIKKLDGGGDWHIAYLCLYRTKNDSR